MKETLSMSPIVRPILNPKLDLRLRKKKINMRECSYVKTSNSVIHKDLISVMLWKCPKFVCNAIVVMNLSCRHYGA